MVSWGAQKGVKEPAFNAAHDRLKTNLLATDRIPVRWSQLPCRARAPFLLRERISGSERLLRIPSITEGWPQAGVCAFSPHFPCCPVILNAAKDPAECTHAAARLDSSLRSR